MSIRRLLCRWTTVGTRVFRWRFRMWQDLFLRIVQTMEGRDSYFQQWQDVECSLELSPLKKCIAALRQLAYGTTTNMFDEVSSCRGFNSAECLAKFCEWVVGFFSSTYLRKPTATYCQVLADILVWARVSSEEDEMEYLYKGHFNLIDWAAFYLS